MKLLSFLALTLALALSPLQARPFDPKGDAKITKNEAEHLALKKHPGFQVTAAKLETVDGKLVWTIEIAPAKGKKATHVTVDATSGHVLAEKKAAR